MESPLPPDPYKALDVPKDASLATIRSAHRKLVLKTHPDKVQGDEVLKKKRAEEFHTIQQSYEILSDDARRKAYDDRVRLATLRAEMMAERPGQRTASDTRNMTGRSPIIEVRGGRVYEERAPRTTYDDYGDDFFTSKPRDTRPKYDDPYAPSSSRKSSIRLQEDKIRARDLEEERERDRSRWERSNAKAEKKSVFAERDRRRDRVRRKDHDSKYRGAYVEEASETTSDSSDTEVTYQPRRREEPTRPRYEEMRKRDPEETPRRTSKRTVEDGYPDGYVGKAHGAAEYIRQAQVAEPEIELRRPPMYKGASTREVRPTPAPTTTSEHPRRSSGRPQLRRESSPPKLSAKNRRLTEIVDPPEIRTPRMMPVSSSDPKGLRGMTSSSGRGKPHRASTAADPDRYAEPRQPSIRRSETMPLHRPRHDDQHFSKSSRSKEIDSGYSSPDTTPAVSPKKNYNTKFLTPEDKHRRERDMSPPLRKSSERPAMSGRSGTTSRMPPTRTYSYAIDAEDPGPPPRLKRAETTYVAPLGSRPSASNSPRQLWGEMPHTEEPYKIVHHAPKIGPDDVRYGKYDRRGSEEAPRDWYSGSDFDSRTRPSHGRTPSRVY
ncbi:MAG: hypothetical protein L6R40_005203 [Gallowayella cf. fulva]|nr:MAG: hypothetical protein L6R40_005203 [Xanthomendoza cf. fulva]